MVWQVIFVSLCAVTWVTVLVGAIYLDGWLGGWRNLATKYPALPKEPPNGERLRNQTIRLDNGGVSYHSVVSITMYREGIQLDMPTMAMRLFYPSMFLPWKDVVAASRERWWFWDHVRLTFADAPSDPISIHGALANQILATVGPMHGSKVAIKY